MTNLIYLSSVFITLTLTPIGTATLQQPVLTVEDLRCCGLSEGLKPDEILRILGKPTKIIQTDDPFEPGSKLVTWQYKDLLIGLGEGEALQGVTILSSKYGTKRGLHVGDGVQKLRGLYGEPSGTYPSSWDYEGPEGLYQVMRVTVEKSKVVKIYLGWLSD